MSQYCFLLLASCLLPDASSPDAFFFLFECRWTYMCPSLLYLLPTLTILFPMSSSLPLICSSDASGICDAPTLFSLLVLIGSSMRTCLASEILARGADSVNYDTACCCFDAGGWMSYSWFGKGAGVAAVVDDDKGQLRCVVEDRRSIELAAWGCRCWDEAAVAG